MARYIFITGGVVSSLGKGLASAALGALLLEQAGEGQCAAEASTAAAVAAGVYLAAAEVPLGAESAAAAALHGVEAAGAMSTG